MMLYSTLKANKEHGVRYIDIFIYYEECYGCAGELFGDDYCEYDKWGIDKETNDEKLFEDFTERQVASACLKALRKDSEMLVWNKILFDLTLPELVYEDLEKLIHDGVITGSNQLREINQKAKRKGVTIKKEIEYDTENHYWAFHYVSDLIDEYFPCHADTHDDYCNNCGNCH